MLNKSYTESIIFLFAVSFFFLFSLPPYLSAIDNVFVPVILMTRTTATTDVNDRQSGSSSDRRSGQPGRRHDVTLGGPSVLIHWLLLSVNGFHCLCLYFVCSCSFVHSFDPFLSTSSNRLAAALPASSHQLISVLLLPQG